MEYEIRVPLFLRDNYDRPLITNCILWYNQPDEVYIYEEVSLDTVTYSCIQGGYPGVGNIDDPPLFIDANIIDPNATDFHLQLNSSCIDTGDPNSLIFMDLEGNPRPLDGNADSESFVDMGAYELPCPLQITCPADIQTTVSSKEGRAMVTYEAEVIDNTDPENTYPSPVVTYDPPSGSNFRVGSNTVTVTAINYLGMINHCSFTVTVKLKTPKPPPPPPPCTGWFCPPCTGWFCNMYGGSGLYSGMYGSFGTYGGIGGFATPGLSNYSGLSSFGYGYGSGFGPGYSFGGSGSYGFGSYGGFATPGLNIYSGFNSFGYGYGSGFGPGYSFGGSGSYGFGSYGGFATPGLNIYSGLSGFGYGYSSIYGL